MSELDELIQADGENISNSRRALTSFHPELSAALDTAAEMFKTLSRCMIGVLDDSADLATLADCAKELGIDENTLLSRIESDRPDAVLDRARAAKLKYLARRARGIVFLLLQRHFMWAATDLLRARITAAFGYGRQQAESLALLFLMRDDSSIAKRWLKIVSDSEGIQFYRKFQDRIRTEIDRLDLSGVYEEGSGASLHVRFKSAFRGLSFEGGPDEIRLFYQEVREDDPFSYFLEVLSFLGIQVRVFQALGDAFPEVSDPIWPERVRIFTRTIAYLWKRLEEGFPEQSEKYRRMAQET